MTNEEKFEAAIEIVLAHEGGYVNDPDDPGGETKFGISKRSYPEVNIKDLTVEQAMEIYKRDWWDKYGYGRIDYPAIAAKIFDLSVNMGPHRAHIIAQMAVRRTTKDYLDIDGMLGDLSIAAINKHPEPGWLLDKIKLLAVQYYVSLEKVKYLTGWVKRALA